MSPPGYPSAWLHPCSAASVSPGEVIVAGVDIKVRDIASEADVPGKFLELILLELKNARIVESIRGAKGGYQLRRPPSEIHLSEVIRLIDGPLAPFGDADQLRVLIARDADHRALYQVFLDVRKRSRPYSREY